MIKVYNNLFVGSEKDYLKVKTEPGWFIVQAAKDPFHREALGYRTAGAPKNHPEYLIARRGNRLILNLVDTVKHWMIPKDILHEAVSFIDDRLEEGYKVLVHCNMGVSRSPSIALLYLLSKTEFAEGMESFDVVERAFSYLYPPYSPAGIREVVKEFYYDKYKFRK